ncbi:alpha/beta hydrolase [Vineibacter terrae]|uniref:Alpha/beta hydrolase n=1 Tax=Vineibacter terrae TaxID=2586908 RepID=A0A5C8PM75_9HYPH|nr:alpha/beta hydrolase [Vineibacter terrae]TXL75414.1 alpha/beta hydrolase [Vineibacter terrae]
MSDLERLMAFLAQLPVEASITDRRKAYDRAEKAFPLPEGATLQASDARDERIAVRDAEKGRWLLYLHGGGYGIGSPRSHRHLAAAIGVAARANVLLPDYRLAPEHPFPAAVDDALAAYRTLLGETSADRIVVAGDSAGGGLAVSTVLAAREAGLALPGAAVCLSPWVDLNFTPDSPVARAAAGDPLVRYDEIAAYARAYLGSSAATDPLASPIFADLHGLPPMLIHASVSEALVSDATRLAEAAQQAGVDVTLELTDGTPHVWHWFWPRLDIARASIKRIGAFVEPHLARSA